MSPQKVTRGRSFARDQVRISQIADELIGTPRQELSSELRSRGPVRNAFEEICRAGFDADELEAYLLDLTSYPQKRSERLFSSKDLRRLDRIIRDLDCAGKELGPFATLMYLGGRETWPLDPLHLPQTLRQLAMCIASAKDSRFAKYSKKPNASSQIRLLVEAVRRRTGKPHHAAVATLVGAVYDNRNFCEAHLKTLISRGKGKQWRP